MTFCTDPDCKHIREIHDENGCDCCDCVRSADDPDFFKPAEKAKAEDWGND